jgi:hypothetical protein
MTDIVMGHPFDGGATLSPGIGTTAMYFLSLR